MLRSVTCSSKLARIGGSVDFVLTGGNCSWSAGIYSGFFIDAIYFVITLKIFYTVSARSDGWFGNFKDRKFTFHEHR